MKSNLENLARAVWEAEAVVGDVEIAVGTEGDAGRKDQNAARAVDQDLLLAIGQYANKTARKRFRARVRRRVRGFEHIQTIALVNSHAEHFAQAAGNHFQVTARCDTEDALGVELVRVEL